ncbi:MAG: exodeoxyribonuclease VII large subunit [Oscillospiraceae bacterium]|nr:exodeoxyribonuclease VII large subunit [Oscillospiraceae bacterium]
MEQMIISVSELNQYLKNRFDSDPYLAELCIRGELSNYKVYPSGHHYFTMKDPEGALRCVMFRGNAGKLRFKPENGMKVLAMGRITVFPRDGAYQLYCTGLTPDGVGDLHVAFEQLKAKLLAEGLFDQSIKKPLPVYPHRIAIVTSSAGAAVRDMLRILGKRYPLSKVMILPVRVQGAEAPAEIAGAIRYCNRHMLADVIITGRGGGSMEDLWAFNDERVARAIHASVIPVVSAVGHEPDVTISDFVADLRAATPSNGAELVAPDQIELRQRLLQLSGRLSAAAERRITISREKLQVLSKSRVLQDPRNYLEDRRLLLDHMEKQLSVLCRSSIGRQRERFIRLAAALDAMSPLKVLSRGYAIVQKPDGSVIRSCADAAAGDTLEIGLQDGRLLATVTGRKEDTNGTVENL